MSKVILYIAASLDGFIARPDGNLDWLTGLPNPDHLDHGYGDLLAQTSCIIMGHSTYQEILGFGIEWPYIGTETWVMTGNPDFKPATPDTFALSGDTETKFEAIRLRQPKNIWLVGGGRVVTWFLNHDLIDEMIIAIIPCLLGKGIRLFPEDPKESQWKLVKSESFSTGVVNLSYRRDMNP
jgi:dihydrofolate reductase